MHTTKTRNNCWIILIIASLLAIQTNPFSKTSNKVFSQVKIGTDAKQTDKLSGTQESTLKITKSLPGFVKGKILDNVTGDGIADATVTLTQSDITVTSDESVDDGTFFLRVLPGKYSVTVIKSGFLENNSDLTVSAFETVIKNINMAPTVSLPSTSPPEQGPPEPEPLSSNCKGRGGGNPGGIEVFPGSLTIQPGRTKRVGVRVLKDGSGGCSIDVNIDCISGCGMIELAADTITTNRRGFAITTIKAKARQEGVAVITFSVDDFEFLLPVDINDEKRR